MNNLSQQSLLPISRQLGKESENRIEKRKRIQKLKQLLDEKNFNEIVSREEYDEIMERKTFGARTIAQDLVSVQPLSAPSEIIYYMEFFDEEARKKQKQELRRKKIEKLLNND